MIEWFIEFITTSLYVSFFDFVGDSIFSIFFIVILGIGGLIFGTGSIIYEYLSSVYSKFKNR